MIPQILCRWGPSTRPTRVDVPRGVHRRWVEGSSRSGSRRYERQRAGAGTSHRGRVEAGGRD